MVNSLSKGRQHFMQQTARGRDFFESLMASHRSERLQSLESRLSSFAFRKPASSPQEGMQSGWMVQKMSGEGQVTLTLATVLLASPQRYVGLWEHFPEERSWGCPWLFSTWTECSVCYQDSKLRNLAYTQFVKYRSSCQHWSREALFLISHTVLKDQLFTEWQDQTLFCTVIKCLRSLRAYGDSDCIWALLLLSCFGQCTLHPLICYSS